MKKVRSLPRFIFATALLFGTVTSKAQTPVTVYTDRLVSGFQDWGWAPHNFANTSPVHSGGNSVSITISSTSFEGLQMVRAPFDTTPYSSVTLWINGGTGGGQRLQVVGLAQVGSSQNTWQTASSLGTLQTNTWQQFTIPLTSLGLANKTNCTGIVIQDRVGAIQPTFYVDDIQFNAKPAPALVHLSVNATQTVRSVEARWFAANSAIWDSNFDTAGTIAALQEMGCMGLRYPGGSRSDDYHWAANRTASDNITWATPFNEFVHVATNLGAQAFITVNYGNSPGGTRGGQPKEAAAWVAYANGDASLFGTPGDITLGNDEDGNNWRTIGYWARLRTLTPAANPDNQYDFLAINRSAPLGIKYWEIGNENYGSWEMDSNSIPHHPYTYAVRATNFIALMKLADPTIKVGVVVVPGESSFNNGYTDHPAVNPRTGQTNYGWTPVVLATLKNLGVTPDFLVHHFYPQNAGGESDPLLLQSAAQWGRDAADLRQQLADYIGAGHTNVELVCTENNSISSGTGKQSTSLVNALFAADSLGQLARTEFNALVWWDIRNGQDFANNNDPSLYGWRLFGDYGFLSDTGTRYPSFYGMKLLQYYVRPGDSVLNASSDYLLLSAYAARRASGAVTLLVINKDTITNFNAQIVLNGFTPAAAATIRSFGIPQDEAARTNGPAQARDIATNNFAGAGTNFSFNFPPLSLTLFTLAPAAPRLVALPLAVAGQFVFQLQGQTAVRYVVQASTNLTQWSSVSTNTLTGSSLNYTNPTSPGPGRQYWRAVWQP